MAATTTDFYVTTNGLQDADVIKTNGAWPPTPATTEVGSNSTNVNMQTFYNSGVSQYTVVQGIIFWDTSSLPTGAVISSASLVVFAVTTTPMGTIVAEWLAGSYFPITGAAWSYPCGNNAITAFDATTLPFYDFITIPLTNGDTYVNRTGKTGLRLGMNPASAPTNTTDYVARFYSYDGALDVTYAPILRLTYDTAAAGAVNLTATSTAGASATASISEFTGQAPATATATAGLTLQVPLVARTDRLFPINNLTVMGSWSSTAATVGIRMQVDKEITITKLVWTQATNGTVTASPRIYRASDNALIASGGAIAITDGSADIEAPLSAPVTLAPNTAYVLSIWFSDAGRVAFNQHSTNTQHTHTDGTLTVTIPVQPGLSTTTDAVPATASSSEPRIGFIYAEDQARATGSLTFLIVGTAAASATTPNAPLLRTQFVQATAAAGATTSAALALTVPVAATAAASATAPAALSRTAAMSATESAAATGIAALSLAVPLQTTATALAATTAAVALTIMADATAAGSGSAPGALSLTAAMIATAPAGAAAPAALSLTVTLQTTAQAAAATIAALTAVVVGTMDGSAAGTATMLAGLALAVPVSATAAGGATGTATGSLQVPIAATNAGQASTSAAFALTAAMTATAPAGCDVLGALAVVVPLAATAQALATATASSAIPQAVAATVLAQAATVATLLPAIHFLLAAAAGGADAPSTITKAVSLRATVQNWSEAVILVPGGDGPRPLLKTDRNRTRDRLAS